MTSLVMSRSTGRTALNSVKKQVGHMNLGLPLHIYRYIRPCQEGRDIDHPAFHKERRTHSDKDLLHNQVRDDHGEEGEDIDKVVSAVQTEPKDSF